jgi:uncharacterized protein YcgL (UPF0745 family)
MSQTQHSATRLVKVFKGTRKPDAYLYVDFADELSRVPDALLSQFGETTEVLSLKLTAQRQLARADAAEVLSQIESVGFYLQLPPPEGTVVIPPQAFAAPAGDGDQTN